MSSSSQKYFWFVSNGRKFLLIGFPSLQEEALDEIITSSEAKRTKYATLNGVKTFKGKVFFTVFQGKLEIVLIAILSKIYSTNICNSFMYVNQYKHR